LDAATFFVAAGGSLPITPCMRRDVRFDFSGVENGL